MQVKVTVRGHVAELMPGGRSIWHLELVEPKTIREIVQEIGSNPLLFSVVSVNGKKVDKDYLVSSDAEVVLVSPTAGG